jgi:hypothetical protein
LSEEGVRQVLLRRTSKFFSVEQQIDLNDEHYKPRVEPYYDQHVYTTNDTLVLFGSDFLNKAELKKKFGKYDRHFQLAQLDLSNCMLKFSNPTSAREAILDSLPKDSVQASLLVPQ